MSKHAELIERLRYFDRLACNDAIGVIEAQAREIEGLRKDAERLDWLEQNIFHREMDEWDSKIGGRGNQSMWVLFAPKGLQGSARNIIDAAKGAPHG